MLVILIAIGSIFVAVCMYLVHLGHKTNREIDKIVHESDLNVEATKLAGAYLSKKIRSGEYRISDGASLFKEIDDLRIKFRNGELP